MGSRGTNRAFTANGPDIIIQNTKKREKSCILIDVVIPVNRNYAHKEAENKIMQEFMYRDATDVGLEMYDNTGNNWRQWNSNKGLKNNFETLPRKHSIASLQKTAILAIWHIIRKVLQSEACSLSGVDCRCSRRSTGEKTSETRESGTIISVSSLHLLTCYFNSTGKILEQAQNTQH